MAGTRAPFASLAALAAVASVQAQEDSQRNAVEAAKRDLQSLPTVQRPVEGTQSKSLFPSGSMIPGLAIGTPAHSGGAPQQKENGVPAKTGGWLLDGVNQLEADAQSKLTKTENGRDDGSGNGQLMSSDGRIVETTHPFAGYLDQWLSPADRALLSGDQAKTVSSSAPWEMPRTDFGHTNSQETGGGLKQQMELPGLDLFTQNQPRMNPYLAGESPVQTAAVPFPAPTSSRETPNTLAPMDSAAPTNLLPPVAPRVEQAQAAPSVPPTSRLVDDRKYFPQLRRF
jgi:hypothetical protein